MSKLKGSSITLDGKGRIARIPDRLLIVYGANIVVKATDQYTYNKTASGLIIAGGDEEDDPLNKKYAFGEIIARGPQVPDDLHVGDIVLYQISCAYPMPSGQHVKTLFKITVNDLAIMTCHPNLDPAKRHPSWDQHEHIKDLEELTKQWKTGEEAIGV